MANLQMVTPFVTRGQRLRMAWEKFLSALNHVHVRRDRSLRVAETVSLGDKRLLAVIEFEGRRLLLGATAQNIALLYPDVPAEHGRRPPDEPGSRETPGIRP